MTNPNEVTSLANDLRDKMHDLGLFPQDDTMRRLAIWLVKRMPAAAPARTDVEIVQQTNALARLMLPHIGTGYSVPDGYKFYEERHKHPRAAKCWNAAVEIMEFMTQTNADDALSGIDPGEMDEPAPPEGDDAGEAISSEVEDFFRCRGIEIRHGEKAHQWIATSVLFDALAPSVSRAGPAVRMAFSTLKQRFQIVGMEKVKRFEIDENLRNELRQLARALEAQIAVARQREIDLRNAFEPAFAQMAAAIAKLTGEASQTPTES